MMKLVSDHGRWAKLDGSMVFSNIVYLMEKKDAWTYRLVDENNNPIQMDGTVMDYLVETDDWAE